MAFVRVRIPETGAQVDVHEDALRVHPGLERLERPAADRPRRAKHKRNLTPAEPGTEEE